MVAVVMLPLVVAVWILILLTNKDHTGDIKRINPNPRSVVNPLSDEQFTVGGL